MKAGRLTRTPSAKVRGRALVDLMQGLQLRAKAGIAREQLLQDARSYVPLILGKQFLQELRRERYISIAQSITATDVNHHPPAVNVAYFYS